MQFAYPGQANEVGLPIVAKAIGNPITTGTVNFYLVALTGDNAGKWWVDSTSTWSASETVSKAGTHRADGHWYASLKSAAWIQDVRYRLYAKENGDLHIPVCDEIAAFDPADITFLRNVMEGDAKVDTTTTPWDLVVYIKDTSTELIRKKLKDVTGTNITAASSIIGQQVES